MAEPLPEPPIAERIDHSETIHGVAYHDHYAWLKDVEKTDPKVLAYLHAENEYTEATMKHTKELQAQLYKDMLSRIKETDSTAPYKYGPYYYYRRTEEGKQYGIYCRKKGSLDAPEEIILDHNQLAEGQEYLDLGVREVSPDHNILAYSIDDSGDEQHTLLFKDLRTGEEFEDEIEETEYSLEWANDNKTVFYTTMDDTNRPYKIWRHTLGEDPAKDELLYEETDIKFYASLSKSRDNKFLFMRLGSQVTSEVWALDANDAHGKFKLLAARKQDVEYDATHYNGKFLIVTNEQAKNFKLMQVSVSAINPQDNTNWEEVIPHRPTIKLEDVDEFANHLAVWERENGLTTLRIRDNRTNQFHQVEFPEPVFVVSSNVNCEFETNILRLSYASLTTPSTIYDYNMDDRTRLLIKQEPVLGGYNPSLYEARREYALADDGVRVPVSIVFKKELFKNDGSNPMLLEAYGAYGVSNDPGFDSKLLCLLDRGFVYGIAHIRGGGEMGRQWYEDGKLLKKKNSFTDFVAAIKHVIQQNYTSTPKLAITGASAGGLLMGAVTNLANDLVRVVVSEVPFSDVINTMRDPSLPLTAVEWEEWGNPDASKEYFDYMFSYSPYENVERKSYPSILITAGLHDPRVLYFEPAKLTAKLRYLKTDKNLLLLKTQMTEGHGGASGRYDFLKEYAFNWAFVIDQLSIKSVV